MKTLFSVLVVLSASSAHACPDLSGTFACPGSQDSPASTLTLSQSVENGATVYASHSVDSTGKIDDSKIIADGTPRVVGGEGAPFSFTCEGDASLRGDYSEDVQGVGPMIMLARMDLDGQRNLRVAFDVSMGSAAPAHGEEICIRK